MQQLALASCVQQSHSFICHELHYDVISCIECRSQGATGKQSAEDAPARKGGMSPTLCLGVAFGGMAAVAALRSS